MEDISVVIGSWGSYSECNERALGSEWLNLSDYDNWDDIVEELKEEGFQLDGIDEELFIQDIDGLDTGSIDLDSLHPKTLFEILHSSGVFSDNYKMKTMQAFLEIEDFRYFRDLVEDKNEHWDDDIILYEDQTLGEVAENLADELYDSKNSPLYAYFDYEAFARDLTYDGFYETSYGVIEFR